MARVIDLASLAPSQGFLIRGRLDGDLAGYAVGGAGDVNGDGIADVILGAPYDDSGGIDSGSAWVVFGRDVAGGAPAFGTVHLAVLTPAEGFQVFGDGSSDRAGTSVAGAGDIDGDGIADMILGALYADPGGAQSGAAWVLFGRDVAGGAPAFGPLDLTGLAPADGFQIAGAAEFDGAGQAVDGVGDVNGDGIDDFVVGAPYADGGASDGGGAWVLFGRDLGGGAPAFAGLDLGALDPADGFALTGGAIEGYAGMSASGAGDVNGDGIDDFILGGSGLRGRAGAAWVVYGRDVAGGASPFGPLELDALRRKDGFEIRGGDAGDWAGWAVSGAGDINGDGIDDLVIGGPLDAAKGDYAGAAWVVYGRDVAGGARAPGTIDLGALKRKDGFAITGSKAGDQAGYAVSNAGDINGDGIDDLAVGAYSAGRADKGGAWVIFGRDTEAGAPAFRAIDLGKLSARDGFEIRGAAAGDFAGNSLAAAGDVNGDGYDDLVVGTYAADVGGVNAGGAAVIFGGAFPRQLHGSAGRDKLMGGAAGDGLFGKGGNDGLHGAAGNDLLVGGRGRDMLEGGLGADTFRYVALSDSGPAPRTRDVIADFGAGDVIDLRKLDADATAAGNQAFAWIGGQAFHGRAGELRVAAEGRGLVASADVNGDGRADFEIEFDGLARLGKGDFLL